MSAMPAAHGYSAKAPPRHSLPSSSKAGAKRWMNAVAMMTAPYVRLAAVKRRARTSGAEVLYKFKDARRHFEGLRSFCEDGEEDSGTS
jgi:hypothetical protein